MMQELTLGFTEKVIFALRAHVSQTAFPAACSCLRLLMVAA